VVGVKPLDANTGTAYANSDHAGTPENFRTFVTGGTRGGGGSNFTGSYSATAHVVPGVAVAPGSISGYVYFDANQDGTFNPGEVGLGGVTVTLTGTDSQNNPINMTAVTDNSGFYQFLGLPPGAYMLTEGPAAPGYDYGQASVGTVNGSLDGNVLSTAQLGNILLSAGNNGVNYDFGEVTSSAGNS
jgi:hypothetical protein